MADELIVCLNTLNWGASIGGEHITGDLCGEVDGKYKSIELLHPLTRKEVLYLNKKDGVGGYKVGTLSKRFEDEAHIKGFAIKVWKEHFPKGEILLHGSSLLNPEEILVAPNESLKAQANEIWTKSEKLWDVQHKKARTWNIDSTPANERLADEWRELFTKYLPKEFSKKKKKWVK